MTRNDVSGVAVLLDGFIFEQPCLKLPSRDRPQTVVTERPPLNTGPPRHNVRL